MSRLLPGDKPCRRRCPNLDERQLERNRPVTHRQSNCNINTFLTPMQIKSCQTDKTQQTFPSSQPLHPPYPCSMTAAHDHPGQACRQGQQAERRTPACRRKPSSGLRNSTGRLLARDWKNILQAWNYQHMPLLNNVFLTAFCDILVNFAHSKQN